MNPISKCKEELPPLKERTHCDRRSLSDPMENLSQFIRNTMPRDAELEEIELRQKQKRVSAPMPSRTRQTMSSMQEHEPQKTVAVANGVYCSTLLPAVLIDGPQTSDAPAKSIVHDRVKHLKEPAPKRSKGTREKRSIQHKQAKESILQKQNSPQDMKESTDEKKIKRSDALPLYKVKDSGAIYAENSCFVCGMEDIHKLELLEKDSINSHDTELSIYLQRVIDRYYDSQLFFDIDKTAQIYCINETLDYFSSKHMTLEHFQAVAHILQKQLTQNLLQPRILLKNIMMNFEALQKETARYLSTQQCRSPWSTYLYQLFSQLFGSKTLDDVISCLDKVSNDAERNAFINATKNLFSYAKQNEQEYHFSHQIYALTKKLVFSCLGRFNDEISNTFIQLHSWNQPEYFEVHSTQVMKFISEIAPLAEKSRYITSQRHRFNQNFSLSSDSIVKHHLETIIRSLKPDDNLLFDQIIINGKVCDFKAPSGEDGVEFYYRLIYALHSAIRNEHVDSGQIHLQANNFINLTLMNQNLGAKYGLGKSLLEKTFEDDIPSIGLLRCMTIDCWLLGQIYLRALFPRMFSRTFGSDIIQPYELVASPGVSFDIDINRAGGYSVTQKKKFSLYYTLDKKTPLASLQIQWSVNPTQVGIEGSLQITSWKVLDARLWTNFVSIWTKPVDASQSAHIPSGWTYKPDL